MSSPTAISVQEVSKLYLLYKKPQDRLKQALFRRMGKNYASTFWALQDISFEVEKGVALGIIGRNGSGKSTLLQIIAGTLTPTHGKVQVRGRVAALLELGAGFNPEFTGRENIFLNGAILGISEAEMRRRLEEIIDFAQIGQFIDQPVKFYSSGMYVRLAFAIAASVEPDVLIIDEALAVGDAGFVIKCMNRMKELRQKGVTILLVTHDVQTVRSFCDRAIWLNEGRLQSNGSPLDITSQYIQFLFADQTEEIASLLAEKRISYDMPADNSHQPLTVLASRPDLVRWGSGEIRIEAFSMDNGREMAQPVFEYGESIHIEMQARVLGDLSRGELGFGFAFRNSKGLDIITSTTYEQKMRFPDLRTGQTVRLSFELDNILAPGDYALVLNAEHRLKAAPHYYDFIENAVIFKVVADHQIFSQVLPPVRQRYIISE
jgi:lipopolysaccharide transport system ATP-binding protein